MPQEILQHEKEAYEADKADNFSVPLITPAMERQAYVQKNAPLPETPIVRQDFPPGVQRNTLFQDTATAVYVNPLNQMYINTVQTISRLPVSIQPVINTEFVRIYNEQILPLYNQGKTDVAMATMNAYSNAYASMANATVSIPMCSPNTRKGTHVWT